MSLQLLREQAKKIANELYLACKSKQKGHPMFRSGMFNSGIWRAKWEAEARKTPTCSDATLFVSFLSLDLEQCENVSALWPWESRNQILAKKKNKAWLNALLNLDDHATIFVDLVPKMGIWICDVFNYIPRDVWRIAAKLIARFYRSSKQIFTSIYPDGLEEDDERRQEFFFAKVDSSLQSLFDFSKPAKTKGTTRKVFSTVSQEVGKQQYGDHAHVHRHGLYLLLHVALLDDDWCQKVFLMQKKSFQPHFSKITDPSCLSVWYTALLEVSYFDGHCTNLDWTLIQSLEIS
ncbi:MAG: hypothetical protein CL916_08085, partial [Deltaproteobacteria bacterium]|nr:hypothetical protein [Deltaproteobacteria bacterium]